MGVEGRGGHGSTVGTVAAVAACRSGGQRSRRVAGAARAGAHGAGAGATQGARVRAACGLGESERSGDTVGACDEAWGAEAGERQQA